MRGIYIGPEERFKGRSADCVWEGGMVMAQFDTGELWETHSRLRFDPKDWELEPDPPLDRDYEGGWIDEDWGGGWGKHDYGVQSDMDWGAQTDVDNPEAPY